MHETDNVFDVSPTLMEIEDLPEDGDPQQADDSLAHRPSEEAEPDYYAIEPQRRQGDLRRRALAALGVVAGMMGVVVLISAATGSASNDQATSAAETPTTRDEQPVIEHSMGVGAKESPVRPPAKKRTTRKRRAPHRRPSHPHPTRRARTSHRSRHRHHSDSSQSSQGSTPTYEPEPEPVYTPEPEPTYAPEPEPTYVPTETAPSPPPPPPAPPPSSASQEFGIEH